ncbi:MAG: autotransporter outer membrane beta-barrel domain-containing protein [Gammaproteobacteria bacterium]
MPKRTLAPSLSLLLAVGPLATGPVPAAERCSRTNFTACLNGVSSSVTNGASLRESGGDQDTIATERAWRAEAEAEDEALAAAPVMSLWGSYGYSDFGSDFSFAGTSLAYDADAHNALTGIDRLFAGRYLLGIAGSYQHVDAETRFNGGSQQNDGFGVVPYAALLIDQHFSVDASFGYSWLDYDQQRISPVDGSGVLADFDSERWFAAFNLNGRVQHGAWQLASRVGYLRVDESQDPYLETGNAARAVARRDITLAQVVVGGEVGYTHGAFEPFVGLLYRNDVDRRDGGRAGGLPGAFTAVQTDDDDELELSVGLRWFTRWGVTGSLEYLRVEGRETFDSDSVLLSLRAAL